MTPRPACALFALVPLGHPAPAADPERLPGTPTKWDGFARHDFKVGELDATVVVPDRPLSGRPWVLRASSSERLRTPTPRW